MDFNSELRSVNNIKENYFVKPCPLCNADIRFFLINFTEKVLMCENLYCDYPFGYDNLQFSPLEFQANIEASKSILSKTNKSRSSSVTWSSTSLDIEKVDEVFESEEHKFLDSDVAQINFKRETKPDKHILNDKIITKGVKDLKYLTQKLIEMEMDYDQIVITNKKWLSKLKKLQDLSGAKLVKKEEMELLKEKTPVFGGGKLKIDISTNKDNESSINVQVMTHDD